MRRHQTPRVQGRKRPFYVGIDIGKTVHHAYVLDAEGTPCVPKVLAFPNTRAGYEQLYTLLAEATDRASPAEVTVGCEATGPYWLSLYEALSAQGYHVLVLNPLYVKARRGTTLRGTKTDPVDARLIAEILRREHVPVSHIPEASVQGLRELTRLRADLVAQIGDVKRRIISILDRTFPEFATCFNDVCGLTARTLLETWTLPDQLAAVPTARLAAVLARLSHGHFGAEKARAVKAAAEQSIGVRRAADASAFELQLLLRQIRDLERLVTDLDQEIGQRYSSVDRYLRTIPGVGAATAPAIYAEIGDIRRFTDSDQLVALVGVDPQLHESGQTAGQAKMSKRGSPYLRRAVWHAALTACRLDPMLQAIYDRQRQRGKHHLVALSHVANKLTRGIYAVLKGQRPYHPHYHSPPVPTGSH
jgi:transposase